jgi:hypothetical protein
MTDNSVMSDDMHGVRVLVSIDDTDNLESRGTGFRARQLGRMLADDGLARVRGISRHQLYVHPDIPYTSHNSALCLDIEWCGGPLSDLADITRDYLQRSSAPGSDAGFCISAFDDVSDEVVTFGHRAKSVVLRQAEARDLAQRHGMILEGVTGDEGGVIGAIASVGLRKGAHDGRFVWVEGVRDLRGVTTAGHLRTSTGIDLLQTPADDTIADDERILVEPWPRPVLFNDRAVLLIERAEKSDGECDWRLVPRALTKQY